MTIGSDRASRILALVRLFNGTAALLVPEMVLRRLGTDPQQDPSGIYPMRMFGVRTIVIGADLLLLQGADRRRAARLGIVIHASDTFAAAAAGLRGQLPPKAACATTFVSSVNTALAIIAARS